MDLEAQIGLVVCAIMIAWFLLPWVMGIICGPFILLGKLFRKGG